MPERNDRTPSAAHEQFAEWPEHRSLLVRYANARVGRVPVAAGAAITYIDELEERQRLALAGDLPWNEKTAPNRVRPRECVGNARDALDRCYEISERAAVPLLIEAIDWLRRALEQMAGTPSEDTE